MTHKHNQTGKINFGNIMLSLLVIGVLVVIGLMVTLYLQLANTPRETEQRVQAQQQQASIEMMTPDNKVITSYSETQPIAPAPTDTHTHDSTPSLEEDTAPEPKKINKKITKNTEPEHELTEEDRQMKGAVPLVPNNIKRPEVDSKPTERPRKTTVPRQDKSSQDAIDNLF